MWDNRSTLHFAVHDYGTATRDMNRVTTEGEVPSKLRIPTEGMQARPFLTEPIGIITPVR